MRAGNKLEKINPGQWKVEWNLFVIMVFKAVDKMKKRIPYWSTKYYRKPESSGYTFRLAQATGGGLAGYYRLVFTSPFFKWICPVDSRLLINLAIDRRFAGGIHTAGVRVAYSAFWYSFQYRIISDWSIQFDRLNTPADDTFIKSI